MVSVHNRLCAETRLWFLARRHVSLQRLFYDYYTEAQRGCFKQHFAILLANTDASLPPLSLSLTTAVGEALAVPAVNTRKVLSLIIYWLSQSHSDRARDLPCKADFLDIVQSIMGDDYIFVV